MATATLSPQESVKTAWAKYFGVFGKGQSRNIALYFCFGFFICLLGAFNLLVSRQYASIPAGKTPFMLSQALIFIPAVTHYLLDSFIWRTSYRREILPA